ncbi:MAG TPA: hypothetical protein VMH90_07280 [Thermoplasmata archaeon]|nr:hypothetical protein [Thermoplasmata archaeon]
MDALSLDPTTVLLALVIALATAVPAYGAFLLARPKWPGRSEVFLARRGAGPGSHRTVHEAFTGVRGVRGVEGPLAVVSGLGLLDDLRSSAFHARSFGVGTSPRRHLSRGPHRHAGPTWRDEGARRPEVFNAVAAAHGIGGIGPTPLYLAFPLAESRPLVVRTVDPQARRP